MRFQRASGILLHPTSLPGDLGIGDFGPAAYEFVDFLEEAGQSYWQVLPLGPTGFGDSPYQCFSAFAGNPLLISPEKLVGAGLLTEEDLAARPAFPQKKIDFGAVYEWKSRLLMNAFENFQTSIDTVRNAEFTRFCTENSWWLDDYAAFRAAKKFFEPRPWFEWPEAVRLRDPEALAEIGAKLREPIEAERFLQYVFFSQWKSLKEYASERGVKIIGDVPIFVAHDSADVWCNQNKFKLNPDGTARVVSGVPPDYFSKTGQLWGNPIYDWEAMRREGFGWWIARVAFTLRMVDAIRIDHFRGFAASWEVPGGEKTAANGEWVSVPGAELFSALRAALGDLPVIAEDLGVITADVEQLRDGFSIPGMRILQFAFGGDADNRDLPHNYVNNCVVFTGTHDNDTAIGWWRSKAGKGSTRDKKAVSREQEHCRKYLQTDGAEINWDLIRAGWASVADLAIAPLQDVLGIGSDGRMNLPATTSGNWTWRFSARKLTKKLASRLRDLTELYGRIAPSSTGGR
ncbi:MAG: 4-alpha-glucanotransferase [Chloracidobacterium sp.]|nr:4-alpha-glucanotransferase [Chloracidobacterium sp.]